MKNLTGCGFWRGAASAGADGVAAGAEQNQGKPDLPLTVV